MSKQEGNLLAKTDNAIDNFGTYLLGGGLALGAGYGGYKLYQHLKDKPLHKSAAHSKPHQSKFTAEYDHHSLLQGKQRTDLPDFLQKEIIDSRQKNAGLNLATAMKAVKSAPANFRGMPSKVLDKGRQYAANIDPSQIRNNLAFEANSALGRARGAIRGGLDRAYRAGEGVNMPEFLRRGVDRAYVAAERNPLTAALGTVGALGTGAYMLGAEPVTSRMGRQLAVQYGPTLLYSLPPRPPREEPSRT